MKERPNWDREADKAAWNAVLKAQDRYDEACKKAEVCGCNNCKGIMVAAEKHYEATLIWASGFTAAAPGLINPEDYGHGQDLDDWSDDE